ncbi:tyrosine-type recombinase/integrase [Paraburkholderia caribensis]|nr:tyrosine-type recombinase/integrase [Paraburkholderia caribensis]
MVLHDAVKVDQLAVDIIDKTHPLVLDAMIVTGNTKAAIKAAGGGSSDLWTVPPDQIHYDPRDNVRPLDPTRVRKVADSIKANGYDRKKPLGCFVRKVGGEDRIFVYEGQHRYHGALLAISEGTVIERLPLVIDEAKSVTRTNLIYAGIINNDGEKLTPLQLAEKIVELQALGEDNATICARLTITEQTIRDCLLLANAPAAVHKLVRDNAVASTLAIEEIRAHGGEKALERLQKGLVDAKAAGKTKVTKKHLGKPIAGIAQKKITEVQAKQLLQALQSVLHDPLFDAGAIYDFLNNNWADKLPTYQAMHAWLSKFFAWSVIKRYVTANPCREISVKKPKKRTGLIRSDHFLAIRAALATYTYEKTIKGEKRVISAQVPTGPMMQVFVDLCYLTVQRPTEIRLLEWKQDPDDPFGCSWIDEKGGVIHFVPSKTEDSSGEMVAWPITPEIADVLKRAKALAPQLGQRYVVRDERGEAKTAAACRDAWRDAKRRAGLTKMPYTVKGIRAKAMTDAKALGYDIEALQVAGAHAARETTEIYIKSRQVPVSNVRLSLPAA